MTAELTTQQLSIGGEWVGATGDDAVTVINPATEQVIAHMPRASVADVDRARTQLQTNTWSAGRP